MTHIIQWFLALSAALLISGCSVGEKSQNSRILKIAVNPWVGYTPLMYLDRKGRLKELGIELVFVGSLGENANLLSNHLVDGFAATQYEYLNYKDELDDIVPVFTIDRSAGADKILSNLSVEALKKEKRPIEVYLEFGSVNEDLFRAFVKKYGLQDKKFLFHHDPQTVIKQIKADPKRRVIVVSYEPYASLLEQNGIHEIASTADLDILIIDALFLEREKVLRCKERLKRLKTAFWEAKEVLDRDPRGFYRTVEPYIKGQSYEDFLKSCHGIRWLSEPDAQTKAALERQGIDTSWLL